MTPAPQRGALPTAKWLLRNGFWPVVTRPGEKRPVGTAWGLTAPTLGSIVATFAAHAGAGVGIRLGPEAGVVDLEADDVVSGAPVLERLKLPPTLGWTSARGDHRIYRWDPRLLSLTDKAVIHLADSSLELRIGGAGKQTFSVAPPTPGVIGRRRRRRRWNHVWQVEALPESVLRLIGPKPTRTVRTTRPGIEPQRYVSAALRYECEAVVTAPAGTRNVRLNRAAFSLGTLVGAGLLAHSAAAEALIEAAFSVGLPEREATATIASGLTAGISKPRK